MSLKKKLLTLHVAGLGQITDSLTGRTADGITVQFGEGPARGLSWSSFRMLVKMEMSEGVLQDTNGIASSAMPLAIPVE